jgi:hypothetical protein
MIFLFILTTLSVMANIFLIWYGWLAARKILHISESISFLKEILTDFKEHVEMLYSMNVYHGDEHIKGLIEHSKTTLDNILNFEKESSVFDQEEINLDEEENDAVSEKEEQREIIFHKRTSGRDS